MMEVERVRSVENNLDYRISVICIEDMDGKIKSIGGLYDLLRETVLVFKYIVLKWWCLNGSPWLPQSSKESMSYFVPKHETHNFVWPVVYRAAGSFSLHGTLPTICPANFAAWFHFCILSQVPWPVPGCAMNLIVFPFHFSPNLLQASNSPRTPLLSV